MNVPKTITYAVSNSVFMDSGSLTIDHVWGPARGSKITVAQRNIHLLTVKMLY